MGSIIFLLFHGLKLLWVQFFFFYFMDLIGKRESIFYGMAMVSFASSQFGMPTSMIGESMYW